jgi:hypothetical protein
LLACITALFHDIIFFRFFNILRAVQCLRTCWCVLERWARVMSPLDNCFRPLASRHIYRQHCILCQLYKPMTPSRVSQMIILHTISKMHVLFLPAAASHTLVADPLHSCVTPAEHPSPTRGGTAAHSFAAEILHRSLQTLFLSSRRRLRASGQQWRRRRGRRRRRKRRRQQQPKEKQ